MPKSDNQKLKILYILDYLQTYSHQDNPVGATELMEMLERRGIHCDRKTIYADIAALKDYGADILTQQGKGGGYYLASRDFEMSELKLLIDAVLSSRYLTERKSRELIGKLCALCSKDDADLMKRSVFVDRRVKSMNESIYINVDIIQGAIAADRQITFQYCDWDIDGKRHDRPGPYVASPYGLCQDNANCYLLAHSSRHGVTHYRVDRMHGIQVLPSKRIPCPELTGEALVEYAQKLFQMFGGKETNVKMRFHRSLVNAVVDRFGAELIMIPDGDDAFIFTAPVAVSPMFLSWIIGFGSKAQILYPQWVVRQCCDLCREAAACYDSPKE